MSGRLLVAACFVAYLTWQSPHLVHHLFEPDEVQADCSFLAAADRHQVASFECTPLFSRAVDVSAVAPAVEPDAATRDPRPAGARAPPSPV
jgi:hypothetical protein